MPNFAPVVPISIAKEMQAIGIFGRYHLLLAHDVVENFDAYYTLFQQVVNATIIMDNSAIELGKPVDADTMIRSLDATHVDQQNRIVVVLPDHLMQGKATVDAVIEAKNSWVPAIEKKLPPSLQDKLSFMAVAQGEDITEWCRCCETLADEIWIDWIGIARNYTEKLGASRVLACQFANIVNPYWQQHLLGFSQDLHDDLVTLKTGRSLGWNIRGIDSAVPVRLALRERQEIMFSSPNHSARGDWWDNPGELDTENAKLLVRNMYKIRRWVQD